MTSYERTTLENLTLALESIQAQLDGMTDGGKPVPVQNVRGSAYLLSMAIERLGIMAGTVLVDDPSAA